MQGSINFDGSLVGNITGGGGGGGDTVVITPVVTSGTKIADVSVNGVEKDLYCPTPPTPPEVDITPVVTSGTKIADVSIGGVEKNLYAPNYGADIAALDGRLDTAEYNITGLTTRMGTAEDNITSLTGRVGTAEGNITEIKQSLSQLDGLAVYRQVIPTGDTASFIASDSMQIIKLESDITPVQDLHGYDSPWVGGSGKNKLPLTVDNIKALNGGANTWNGNTKTINDVTFTILTDAANNVIGINANGTANGNASLNLDRGDLSTYQGDILNGCPSGGSTSTYRIFCQKIESPYNIYVIDTGDGAEFPTMDGTQMLIIRIYNGYNAQNVKFYPMIRVSTESSTFAPYSNICPISGFNDIDVSLSPTLDSQDATIYTTNFVDSGSPLTVYGGYIDVIKGLLTVTDGNIASYAGESLPSTWISDRDVYTSGGTPTTGAQVVYKLASALSYQLTAQQINDLVGQNYIWADTGSIKEVGYIDILHLS